eukprot:7385156-Prymnesium_polylepis.1
MGARPSYTPSIDCSQQVDQPVDISPIRSPQAVHSILAELFREKHVVELGTRSGDGISCFSRFTKSAVAIELEEEYCTALRLRARQLVDGGHRSFRVSCQDYRVACPDGDVYTWWEQGPHLLSLPAVMHL